MATRGRPLKITDHLTKKICEDIVTGMPQSLAARKAGISYQTFLNWHKAGEAEAKRLEVEGEEPDLDQKIYLDFFDKVEKAKLEAIRDWVTVVYNASVVSPDWARWMLSKWAPEEFGDQPQKIELTGKDGGAIKTDVTVTDEARIAEALALLEQARARQNDDDPAGVGGEPAGG